MAAITSITDRLRRRSGERTPEEELPDHLKVPAALKRRMDRGRERMKEGQGERAEVLEFWRGNQYVYRTPKGTLHQQDRVTDWTGRSGKPPHRMRQVRNLMADVVAHEVSACTQRIPSYDVLPSRGDYAAQAAARLSQQVALYGYSKWKLREVAERVVTLTILLGEGFAWPFFDTTIGPFVPGEEDETIGLGDVRVRVFTPDQVAWEPGQTFEESRWHTVDVAMTTDEVKAMPGFNDEVELVEDATSTDSFVTSPSKASDAKLVLVTHYLERPSPKSPTGRWLILANNRVIREAQPYPLTDGKGRVLDEPVLHKLSYFSDPDNDRDFGLGRHLLDPQRSYNDAVNKLLEWKNIALVPQLFVTPGLFKKQRLTDEPGAIYEIPNPNENVKFREVPNIPQELFQIMDRAQGDIARIAAQNDIPSQVESGKAIQALIERDQNRRQNFISKLADFHSRLMEHCLYLVQKHYTEPRLLQFQGLFGPDLIDSFMGAQLLGQVDVRVYPASLEPRTRQAVENRIMTYAQLGWITPQAAMAAINGGTAEGLVQSYERDVERAWRIIQRIRRGAEALLSMPADPVTGIPDWMPRPFDNVAVHKSLFEDWMKTQDYETATPPMRHAAELYYRGLLFQESAQAARDQAAQIETAQNLGMANATRPTTASMPSLPAAGETTSSQAAPDAQAA